MINLQNDKCQKCPELCQKRRNVVNGSGPLNAKILIVSEWPGAPEDRTGDIWSGPIGDALKPLLLKAGINPMEVFLTTTIRCYPKAPPSTNKHAPRVRDPKKEEIEACADYLDQEIAAIQPNVIVPMGTVAARRIFGKVTTIKSTRGAEVWSEKYNCKVIPIYHPLVLNRLPEYEGFTVEDLRRIKRSSEYKEPTPKKTGQYVIVDTEKKFDDLLKRLSTVDAFSYDIETSGLNFLQDKVLCVAFSWKSGTACVLPITRYEAKNETVTEMVKRKTRKKVNGAWVETGFKEIPKTKEIVIDQYFPYWGDKQDQILEKLKAVFANDVVKIAHNGKFDNKFLNVQLGFTINRFVFDTMLAHHLLNENAEGMHDLKECAWNYTEMGGYDEPLEKWFEERGITRKKRNYAHVPPEILYPYAGMDADVTFQLYELFKPRLEAEQLQSIFGRLVMPLSQTLMEAEVVGVRLDQEYLEKYKKIVTAEIARREEELRLKCSNYNILDIVEKNYNFNSNDQLADIFFNKLKLPVVKTTAKSGKPACDEEVLKTLAPMHEIPALVKEYREVTGVLSKYIDGLEKRLDHNYRLHSNFLIHGTVTGRLSSSDPNLQNIPRDPLFIPDVNGDAVDKKGNKGYEIKIKNLFVPEPGSIWVEADYAQAEFRHWANYSKDQDMIRDIIAADNGTGPDIHKKTASIAWNIPIEQVTKQQRDAAKRIVFGIMYGRQAESIAEQLTLDTGVPFPLEDAQKIIDQFLARYPVASEWLELAVLTVQKYGQIRDIFGRLRRLPGINSAIDYIRQEHERLAMNSPIQAAASDMNCNAANRIRRAFKEKNVNGRILILVHDAIYCEIAQEDSERGISIMREEMERPIEGVIVPMRAEVKTGDRWGKVKDYEFKKIEAIV
jgi:uracil-DNA glycosylase family 4